MDIFDVCDTLVTPNTDQFVLSNLVASKNNPKSAVFVFDTVQDYAKNQKEFESLIWTFTNGAVLPPCQMALRGEDGKFNGKVANKSVNLGGVQLVSLLIAFDDSFEKEDIMHFLSLDRDSLVKEGQIFIGRAVNTPMSGRVKGKDGVVRTQFKFPEFSYDDDPETNTCNVEEFKGSFSSVDEDTQSSIQKESAYNRNTRKEDAVVPEGMQDGDEILM